jgi:hypothetical protein
VKSSIFNYSKLELLFRYLSSRIILAYADFSLGINICKNDEIHPFAHNPYKNERQRLLEALERLI